MKHAVIVERYHHTSFCIKHSSLVLLNHYSKISSCQVIRYYVSCLLHLYLSCLGYFYMLETPKVTILTSQNHWCVNFSPHNFEWSKLTSSDWSQLRVIEVNFEWSKFDCKVFCFQRALLYLIIKIYAKCIMHITLLFDFPSTFYLRLLRVYRK